MDLFVKSLGEMILERVEILQGDVVESGHIEMMYGRGSQKDFGVEILLACIDLPLRSFESSFCFV